MFFFFLKKRNANTLTKSVPYTAKPNRHVLEMICCFVFEGPWCYFHYYSLLSSDCQGLKDPIGKLVIKLGWKKRQISNFSAHRRIHPFPLSPLFKDFINFF